MTSLDSKRAGAVHPGTDDELLRLLTDAETTVQRLNDELQRRHHENQREAQHQAQHEEIEKLAEHLQAAQLNWQIVREFIEEALAERRSSAEAEQWR
ncbi:MAG: hypothetical protein ACTHW1_05490 [Ancrocorticia sp.]|uniref:hypothetical protein n=1 Tax=Ancrocorticia sp. TaxID=2593684 RepID=UPI003F903645